VRSERGFVCAKLSPFHTVSCTALPLRRPVRHLRPRPAAQGRDLVTDSFRSWPAKSRPVYYVWALIFFVVVGLLSLATIYVFFPGYYDRPGGAASQYASVDLGILTLLYAFFRESIYVALGEELFFRGLLGGWLMRHLGYWVGNSVQSLVFLAPHLLVLSAGLELWPLLLAPLVSGWFYGWLLYRSGSILPGWLAHGLGIAFAAAGAMD
jgi:membrane protease YdiL (CAAX protease family)